MKACIFTRPASGFTLVELVAVVVILGSIAAVAIPTALDLRREARIAVLEGIATTMVANMDTAISAWHVRGGNTVTINGRSIPVIPSGTDTWGGPIPRGSPTGGGAYLMLNCGDTPTAHNVSAPCAGLPGYMIMVYGDSWVAVWKGEAFTGWTCFIGWHPGFGFDPAYPTDGTRFRRGYEYNFSSC